jgi:hypothetical protein
MAVVGTVPGAADLLEANKGKPQLVIKVNRRSGTLRHQR